MRRELGNRVGILARPHASVGNFAAADLGKQYRKFVAAALHDDIVRAQTLLPPIRHRLEQLIVGGVAETIINVLEPVDIDKRDTDLRFPARARDTDSARRSTNRAPERAGPGCILFVYTPALSAISTSIAALSE